MIEEENVMKKILAVLIALMLTALCCFAAVAEGTIDFSGYTLEELLTIRDDLTDEIDRKSVV